jgi:hypothetical protein
MQNNQMKKRLQVNPVTPLNALIGGGGIKPSTPGM